MTGKVSGASGLAATGMTPHCDSTLLQPPEGSAAVYWDQNLPGFGLRISPLGKRVWVCQYRIRGGREVLETIGSIALIPKLGDARERARASILKAREGVEPRRELLPLGSPMQAESLSQPRVGHPSRLARRRPGYGTDYLQHIA